MPTVLFIFAVSLLIFIVMYDYLAKYHLSTDEREWMLMLVVKRLSEIGRLPLWMQKHRNLRTWSKLKALYGEDVVRNALHNLRDLGLTTTSADNLVVLTKRGRAVRKRGWVETKTNKFANPKYPFIISILALMVSFLNGQYTWAFIQWVLRTIEELSSRCL